MRQLPAFRSFKLMMATLPVLFTAGCNNIDFCEYYDSQPVLMDGTTFTEGDTVFVRLDIGREEQGHWIGPEEFQGDNPVLEIPNVTLDNAGEYDVWTDDGACVSQIKTFTLTVNPLLPNCNPGIDMADWGTNMTIDPDFDDSVFEESPGFVVVSASGSNDSLVINFMADDFPEDDRSFAVALGQGGPNASGAVSMELFVDQPGPIPMALYNGIGGRVFVQYEPNDDILITFCGVSFNSPINPTFIGSGSFYLP